jgi:hypothetical protein
VIRVVQSFEQLRSDDCCEGTPDGQNLPRVAGLYAFKHQNGQILYVGKNTNIHNRFRDEHKMFVELFFARYLAPDIRIAIAPLTGDLLPYSEVVKAMVILTLMP